MGKGPHIAEDVVEGVEPPELGQVHKHRNDHQDAPNEEEDGEQDRDGEQLGKKNKGKRGAEGG
jgi:hypothetical protein